MGVSWWGTGRPQECAGVEMVEWGSCESAGGDGGWGRGRGRGFAACM